MAIISSFNLITMAIIASLLTAYASDPNPLQDFCVAANDSMSYVFVNGKFCKNPNTVTADDFFFSGLNRPGNTSNRVGSRVTPVSVNQLPGLNTLGISLARIDYAPYGLNPPHVHPRATEVLFLAEGALLVGFVGSNPADPTKKNELFTKTMHAGDVFVFPEGLVHFQFNEKGDEKAVAFAGLSSQNPGLITVGNAVFGSEPEVPPDVLTRTFQMEQSVILQLLDKDWHASDRFKSTFPYIYDPIFNTSPQTLLTQAVYSIERNLVFVNGKICKNPNLVTADDFSFYGLNKPGNTSNKLGSKVTPVNVNQVAGLNTLGISFARIDYAPLGLNPPHTHPRATEILVVVEGVLSVGFVTSNPTDPNKKNTLFSKTLYPGDVFVFPQGLVHFQFNNATNYGAVAFAGLSSQNPGVITIANALIGSEPEIPADVLAKTLQMEQQVIMQLQDQEYPNND